MTLYYFYRITHKDYPLLNYIGSTNNIKRRKIQHKYNFLNQSSNEHNKSLYQFLRSNNISFKDLEFEILLEDECFIPFLIENLFIQQFNSIEDGLNDRFPFISENDRKQKQNKYQKNAYQNNPEHREKRNENSRIYYQENREKISVTNMKYNEENYDKIREYQKHYKQDNKNKIENQNKVYIQNNLNKILENNRQYYQINKDIINQKVVCSICNLELNKGRFKKTSQKKALIIDFYQLMINSYSNLIRLNLIYLNFHLLIVISVNLIYHFLI